MIIKGYTEIVPGIWYENATGLPWSTRKLGCQSDPYGNPLHRIDNKSSSGYYYIHVNGKSKSFHSVVYEYFNGPIPSGFEVDHKDNNRKNNNINNLQLLLAKNNSRKRLMNSNNTSGYTGVYKDKKYNSFKSQIIVNNNYVYLGSFKTGEEAYQAYLDAKIRYHGIKSLAKARNDGKI
jgi:hypothetical protein